MNRFLVIGFEFRQSRYHSLILCKTKDDGAEYRITVMHGDIEKQLCNDNIIREVNGCLQFERSGNELQNQVKTEIARALGNRIGIPVRNPEGMADSAFMVS
ncbi:hypothetical protein EXU57_14685 [Segetibacter sp. 3557_3]|uniref:hypothetical protein n=1 Tax=Segetibacter sp. 3557_3 TaxID=2547429 RepID=UPI0010588A84|nr:hypothetical protein [Segetibacter sp. 3557_3]TDH24584.1 hypothetical protein EXU57_14685 [Segetibacter sp. 3557_3]